MSFLTMAKTLTGEIPNVSEKLVKNKINEALQKIYDETDWSFQTNYNGWLAPGLVSNVGTTTVTPYSDQIIGDAVASAAWAALVGRPLLTELQYRDPSYSLYNIIAYDTSSNAPFGTLTLDRPWMEPTSGAGQTFQIYQAYFPVPVLDFNKFIEIRDTIDGSPVDFLGMSQDDLSLEDPQRLQFGPSVPTFAVPYGADNRPDSSTPGYTMYELWPHVLARMPYSFSYKRQGPLLVKNGDLLLNPLTEELVTWRTKEVLYQYKEAQKGEQVQRGSGADWRFLAEAAGAEYKARLKQVRAKDANLHRDFLTRKNRVSQAQRDGFSTNLLGNLNIGRF